MLKDNWTTDLIPNLEGETAIVTGANTGLGFQTTLELARKGAMVIIACRNIKKGNKARQKILEELPFAKLDIMQLDLTSLDSVKLFARDFLKKYEALDILINNAAVVNLENLERTWDGHEMHMATNHLGHFALTALLSKLLVMTPHSRVVTLSSGAYKAGVINFDDFKWEKRSYSRVKAYGDSKLANLLFTYELQNYFKSKYVSAIAVSAHPGLTATKRQQTIGIGGKLSKWLATPVEKGCAPQLLAATYNGVQSNDFYGPKFLIWGPPVLKTINKNAMDKKLAKALWEYSEKVTGVKFYE